MTDLSNAAQQVLDYRKKQTTSKTSLKVDDSLNKKDMTAAAQEYLSRRGYVKPQNSRNSALATDNKHGDATGEKSSENKKKDNVVKWAGKQAMAGINQFNAVLAQTIDLYLPTDFLGKYDPGKKLNQLYSDNLKYYANEAEKSSKSRGKGWSTAGQLLQSTVAAVPDLILAYMSGGMSLGNSVVGETVGVSARAGMTTAQKIASYAAQGARSMMKNPVFWTSYLRTAGSDYEDIINGIAKRNGSVSDTDRVKAAAVSTMTSLLNAGVEVGGGIEELPAKLKNGGGKGIKTAVKDWVESMFDEGKEEVVQGVVSQAMASMMYDKDKELFSTTNEDAIINPSRAKDEFIGGAVVGGVLGGAQMGVNAGLNAVHNIPVNKYGKSIGNDTETVNALIESGLASPQDSEAYKYAEQIKQKLDNGKSISNTEIGRMALFNQEQINAEAVENETAKHTPEQLHIMEEYKNAVDSNILDFVKYAREHKTDNRTSITLSEVTTKGVNDIKQLTGIDAKGFEHSLKTNTIRHIDEGHGINGTTDHSMSDDNDIARIPYILDHYDNVELVDKTSAEYRDKNQRPAPMIKYSKRIDGTYYVVEAVPDTKKRQLAVISAYKTKAEQQTADVQAPAHVVQNASADSAFNNSISQSGETVKQKKGGFTEISESDKIPGLLQDEYSDYLTLEEKTAIDEVAAAVGVPVKIVPTISSRVNGMYGNGVIYLSLDAENKPMIVFSHEVTHHLQVKAPTNYKIYKNAVLNVLAREAKKDVTSLVNERISEYSDVVTLSYDEAGDELAADFTTRILSDPNKAMEFVNRIENVQQKKSVIRGLIDSIKSLLEKIKGKFKKIPQEVVELQKISDMFENMLKEAAGNKGNANHSDNVTRYMFAGENAETADLQALQTAKQMEQQGAAAESIWRETGWGRGRDGKWRFEIDDSKAGYNPDGRANNLTTEERQRYDELFNKSITGEATEAERQEYIALDRKYKSTDGGGKLSDYLDHTELYKAYPEMADVNYAKVNNGDSSQKGSYDSTMNGIAVNENLNKEAAKSTTLHESQHAIQDREGFAKGANVEYWAEKNKETEQREKQYKQDYNFYLDSVNNVFDYTLDYDDFYKETGLEFIDFREHENLEKAKAYLKNNLPEGLYKVYENYLEKGEQSWKRYIETDQSKSPYDLYRNTAGEAEARDVQNRMNMTADERRNTFPESMNPNDHVVFADNGVSYNAESDGLFKADDETIRNLSEQVERWNKGGLKSSEVFKIGSTPAVLKEIGADNLPVVMTQAVMEKITGGKHDVPLDVVKQLPQAIADPIMVFNSATVKDAFVMLTELTDRNGKDIVVAMHLNRTEKHINVNRIASVYGKENIRNFVEKQVQNGNLRYVEKNKSQEWSQSRGLQLPKLADTILNSNYSILQKDDIVKHNFQENNAQKLSLKSSSGEQLQYTSAKKIAKSIIDDYGVKGRVNLSDVSAGVEKVRSKLYDTYFGKGDIGEKYAELESLARETAEGIADHMLKTDDSALETYDMLRQEIKGTKIKISDKAKSDFGDWQSWRKRNFGKVTISEDGIAVDSYYRELQEQYPQFFDQEIQMTESDQLQNIVDVLNNLKPKQYKLSESEHAESVIDITNDILSKAIEAEDYILSDNAPVGAYPESYTSGEVKEKLKSRTMTERARAKEQTDKKLQNQKERFKEREAQQREKTKERMENQRRQLLDKVKESKERARVQKQESADRNKLLNTARRLQHMKTIPENMAKIRDIIDDLNTQSRRILKKGYTRADGIVVKGQVEMQKLVDEYYEAKRNDPDFIPSKKMDDMSKRLNGKNIDDLSISDVRDLTEALLEIENEIKTSTKMLNDEQNREIAQVAAKSMEEIGKARGVSKRFKDSSLDSFITTQLSPDRMFRRMSGYAKDSAFEALGKALNNGQRKSIEFRMNASKRFNELTKNKKEMERFTGKHAELIDISEYDPEGRKVFITPAIRTTLYMHSKNYDNMRHIAQGGITIPDMEQYRKGKINTAYDSDGITLRLTPSQIQAITSKMTPFEKQFADAAYLFFNEDCKNAVNAASLMLKGYEIATVEDYFPIVGNKNFVKGEFESLMKDGTLEGKGMLKERAQANNPITLEDITKVIARHMSDVGDYSGLAVPIRNFNRVYNAIGSNYGRSMKAVINRVWGTNATKYIEQLMTDLQGGKKGTKAVNWVSKYAQATLSINPGVTLKQAASYPTAAAVVGWKPLMRAFGEKVTEADKKIIEKYTPLLWYRSQGYTTSELGDYANGSGNDIAKKIPVVMGWIQKMDMATTTKLWKAAEFYVRDHNSELKIGSDEYYKKTAEIYNDIIEKTQPNYTTMQRPDILRKASGNALIKSVTMFKTQPMQNFNILYDAVGEYKARTAEHKANPTKGSEAAKGKAGVKLGNAIVSQFAAALVLNLCDGAGKFLKGQFFKHYGGDGDDDEGKLTPQSFLSAYTQDNISTLVGNVWFGSEAVTLLLKTLNEYGIGRGATWYDMETPELDMVNNIVNDLNSVNKMIAQKKTNPWNVTKKISNTAYDLGTLFGVPAKNMRNLIKGIYKDFTDITKSENFFDSLDAWSEGYNRTYKKSDGYTYQANMSFKEFREYNAYYEKTVDDMRKGRIKKKDGTKYSENGIKQAARKQANEKFSKLFTEKVSE